MLPRNLKCSFLLADGAFAEWVASLNLEVGLRPESARQPYLVKSSNVLVRGVLQTAEPP
jgi:hypothetical protein